ncbi:family 10 glycosylhydrolase [Mariniflexile litorale]|uniref:Family 10 glycosylhydrolase n=1 Tax=Mariniflexile litorale TaxID=3045158 RepID=A0AAU7EEZ1_9FLAO|nr:family 10 glycosylhydrolase [Mariniflexile sp. KMM 9835]MDQ8213162.1 family 10 glycosylhydrolase [Mariniflexile sp. KMM 9835]
MKIFAPYFLFFFITTQAQVGTSITTPKASLYINTVATHISKATAKGELRGVFLPSISSLSWPTNRKATPAEQQAELITILDNLKANGYNTVFLQVRPECDALYASEIDPWSYWLTGTQGKAPSPLWDPLEFAVTEAHVRGLDLHAWLNPYRVKQTSAMELAPNNVAKLHPTWTFQAKLDHTDKALTLKMLNPGLPAVRDYIVSVIQDIANRYDIDGIHFDDYFYPYSGMETTPQDAQTYIDNNPTCIATIEDWRRNNVNLMIGMVYDTLQTINISKNKNIVFGVSPFGIWKSGTPSNISGTSSFNALFCDPIAWLNSGKVDYLAPQLYWKITKAQDYIALSKWWNDQAKLYSKQLYVSQGYYRMDYTNPWEISEIQNQINHNRQPHMDATFGQIAYSYTVIKNNLKGLNGTLNSTQFKYKSFAPPILGLGKDNICPIKPANIRFEPFKILWDTPEAASDGDLPVKYVVYAFDNPTEAISKMNDSSKILDIVSGNEFALTQTQMNTKVFVVTSLDKNNNEAGDFTETNKLGLVHTKVNELVINPVPNVNPINIVVPDLYNKKSI